MRSVGGCSVRSVWIGMARTNHVLTAGLNSHSILKTQEVCVTCLYSETFLESYNASGKRVIQALGVKCRNVDQACKWVGTVGTLEAHVATCEFALVRKITWKKTLLL